MKEALGSTNDRHALSAEMQALVAGVGGKAPEPGLDWEKVRHLAFVHSIAPLLHQAWRVTPGTVPANVLAELQQCRRQSLLRGMWGIHQRDDLLTVLQRDRIRYVVLKGAALTPTWYGDLSLRPFLDIDILIDQADMQRARHSLVQNGYRDISSAVAPHHLAPLAHAGLPCMVELHHQLARLAMGDELSFEALNSRAITLPDGIRTLNPEDTLLHLCLHVLSHVEYDHGWQLRHLCDIARHLDAFAVDWDSFSARSRVLGVQRAGRAILGLAVMLTDANVPPDEVDSVEAQQLLEFPLPGQIDHRLLALFVDAVRCVDLKRAGSIAIAVSRQRWSDEESAATNRSNLLRVLRRLLHESVREPGYLAAQLRLWLPEARRRRQREMLLTSLLTK